MNRKTSIEFQFYIECKECGGNLEATVEQETIIVKPCRGCMDDRHNNGFDAGFASTESQTKGEVSREIIEWLQGEDLDRLVEKGLLTHELSNYCRTKGYLSP